MKTAREIEELGKKRNAAFAIYALVSLRNLQNSVAKMCYQINRKVLNRRIDNEIKNIIKEFRIK